MFWESSGKISKLNNFLQESLLLQPIVIVIIFSCNLKMYILSEKCPQNNCNLQVLLWHSIMDGM